MDTILTIKIVLIFHSCEPLLKVHFYEYDIFKNLAYFISNFVGIMEQFNSINIFDIRSDIQL